MGNAKRRRRRSAGQNLVTSVYARLRDAILRCEYRPGARLNEDELARRLQVSRTPLREALRQLELEGLVMRTRYQGVSVKQISPREILELFDLREVLEGLAARLATERMSDGDVEKLCEIFTDAERRNRAGDYQNYLDSATRFHELLLEISGSELLSRFMRNMYDRIRLVRSRTIHLPGRAANSLEEHRRLLEAIRNRNVNGAEDLNRARIRAIKQDVLQALRNSLVW